MFLKKKVIFFLQAKILKKSILKHKLSYLNYYINLFQKNGNKLKARRFVTGAFKQFYDLFLFCNDSNFNTIGSYFAVLKSYSFS